MIARYLLRQEVLRAIAVIVAVIGVWVLLQGPEMGMSAANGFLRQRGGSMDTATFLVVARGYIDSYLILGGVMLGVGAFVALRSS